MIKVVTGFVFEIPKTLTEREKDLIVNAIYAVTKEMKLSITGGVVVYPDKVKP